MKERLRKRMAWLQEGEQGFTLVELLVVMLVIAILLAIAIPTFLSVIGTAKNTSAQSDVGNAIIQANSVYTQDGGAFGTAVNNLVSELQSGETNIKFADGTSTGNQSMVAPKTVYVAAFYCYSAAGVLDNSGGVVNTGPNTSTDNNCQGVVLEAWASSTQDCWVSAILKTTNPANVTILGQAITASGTYYQVVKETGVAQPACPYIDTGNTPGGTAVTVSGPWQTTGFPKG